MRLNFLSVKAMRQPWRKRWRACWQTLPVPQAWARQRGIGGGLSQVCGGECDLLGARIGNSTA